MKSFYSLIKICPNTLSGDIITIGIILFNKCDYLVKFSDTKKNIAKSLVNIDKDLIDFLSDEIKNKCNENNEFKIKFDYFNYLSDYSNGLLKLSKPNTISLELAEKNLDMLFHYFVESEKLLPKTAPHNTL